MIWLKKKYVYIIEIGLLQGNFTNDIAIPVSNKKKYVKLGKILGY